MSEKDARPKKIAVVGPVDPYRGGVAMHTTQLAQTLEDTPGVDVRVISFSSLYPGFLYPGESDRAPDGLRPESLAVDYAIDSINPFTWMRAAAMLKIWGAEQVVIPAWTFFTAPSLGMIARSCRKNGMDVTMVVHNAADHEASAVKSRLSNFQLNQADRYIAHSAQVAEDVQRLRPGAQVVVSPHPIFRHYPPAVECWPRRASLELLLFGLVRPYKGLDIALEALARSGRRDIHLSIAGEFWHDRKRYDALIARHGLGDLVEIADRYVSDREAAEYFSRADAVLLPYRSVSGTGVAPLAYRYGKPVIASDLPGLREIVKDNATGWLFPAESVEALAQLLAGLTAEDCGKMTGAIENICRDMSWERFVEGLLSA